MRINLRYSESFDARHNRRRKDDPFKSLSEFVCEYDIRMFILQHEKFLEFHGLRAVVFQLYLKYLHVKITKPFAGSSINK